MDRFWAKVNKTENCWEWTASKLPGGNGIFKFNKKTDLVHRLSYELAFGNFDPTLCVLHKCDNPGCVKPDHLFLGTHQDNMTDKKKKGRCRNHNQFKSHCVRGHEFTIENTVMYRGWRRCRECDRTRQRRRQAIDMTNKGRRFDPHAHKTQCKQGHEFSEENTFMYRGWRYCRECDRDNSRRYYRAKNKTA